VGEGDLEVLPVAQSGLPGKYVLFSLGQYKRGDGQISLCVALTLPWSPEGELLPLLCPIKYTSPCPQLLGFQSLVSKDPVE
jgi:hypothetical protein